MEQKEILTIQYNKNENKIICSNEFLSTLNDSVKKNLKLLKYYNINQKKILAAFFASNKEVPNTLRYSVDNNLQTLIGNIGTIGFYNESLISNNFERSIIIILESPHTDEYDSNFIPIAPAQGTTGINIETYLLKLLKLIKNQSDFFTQQTSLNILIVNPVPFQTSLAYLTNGTKDDDVRDQVWRTIWHSENYQRKFSEKVNNFNNIDLIINACTTNLKSEITNFLINNSNISPIYECSHPSSWHSFHTKNFNLIRIR
ncbi:hypothetical protein [Lysinibacillus sp. NPDC093692]|uniref:hypothetical protein n=1 Tax=Lysinibacillus sp. NPDC093692 TaxID=3390578 RepID=UPI003D03026C